MSLTLTASPTESDVVLQVTYSEAISAGMTLTVIRVIGTASSTVRGASGVPFGADGWAQRDTEILFGVPVKYTAMLRDSSSALVATVTTTATVAGHDAVLRDVLMPSRKTKLRLTGMDAQDTDSTMRRELLRPLGRRRPVAVTDVRAAPAGTMTALTLTDGEASAMRTVLGSGRALLLTGPADFDPTWPRYISAGDVHEARVSAAQSPARLFTIRWDEIDPPALTLFTPLVAKTWRDVQMQNSKWADLVTTSWLDVVYPSEQTFTMAGA